MLKRLFRRLRPRAYSGIKKRLHALLLLASLIPALLISFFILPRSISEQWNTLLRTAQENLNKTANYINLELEYCLRFGANIVSNYYLVNLLDADYMDSSEQNYDLYQQISMYSSNLNTSGASFAFYLDNTSIMESTYTQRLTRIQDEALKQSVLLADASKVFWRVEEDTKICYYRNVAMLQEHAGILKVTIPYDKIEYFLKNANIEHGYTSLNGQVFYGLPAGQSAPDPSASVMEAQLLNGMKIYAYIPNQLYQKTFFYYGAMWLAVLALFLLTMWIVTLSMSRFMVAKMEAFVEQLIDGGLYRNTDQIQIKRSDEFATVKRKIKELLDSINRLHEENTQTMKKKQQLELELLQSKINPHMLYNTLSAIKWNAIMLKNTRQASAIDELARFYRFVLSNGKNVVSLREELQLVQSYINIMNYAHSHTYRYSASVPEELLSAPVIKNILQPIVENALLHGVNHQPDGEITLTAKQEGNLICIRIADNGCGISPEKLEEINTSSYRSTYKNYGIRNIKRRLSLYYSDECGLSFDSAPGKGTTVTVRLEYTDYVNLENKFDF